MYSDVNNSLTECKTVPQKRRSVVSAAQIWAKILHPSIHSSIYHLLNFLRDSLYLFFHSRRDICMCLFWPPLYKSTQPPWKENKDIRVRHYSRVTGLGNQKHKCHTLLHLNWVWFSVLSCSDEPIHHPGRMPSRFSVTQEKKCAEA